MTEEQFERLQELEEFCWVNNINKCNDSYYFTLSGRRYRVSDHSLCERKKVGKVEHCYSIVVSPDHLEEVFTALKQGKRVDVRGNIL